MKTNTYFVFYLHASSYSSSLELLLTWWQEEQDWGTDRAAHQAMQHLCLREKGYAQVLEVPGGTSSSNGVAPVRVRCARTSCLELQLLHEICHRVTSSPNTLSPHHLMHVTRALLQSEGLTCVLYPPCFCELGVRRDGLSFPDGDIFNKGHGGYIDIWALKVIIGSDGGL